METIATALDRYARDWWIQELSDELLDVQLDLIEVNRSGGDGDGGKVIMRI